MYYPYSELPGKYLVNLSDPLVEAYQRQQVEMAVMFGAEKSHAEVEIITNKFANSKNDCYN